MKSRKLLVSIISLVAISSYGAYYDTLPKGVRTAVLRHVSTTSIGSKLNSSNKSEDFAWQVNLDGETIKNLNSAFEAAMTSLEKLSPKAYSEFTAGEYKGSAEAQVNVEAFGIGYGLTEKLTTYFYVPYYVVNVAVDVGTLRPNNVNSTVGQVGGSGTGSIIQSLGPTLAEVLNENTYQSIFVNKLGYQPLGDWEGQGLGDMEIGFLYKLTDLKDKGLAISAGVVAPTGQEDRPDVVQDIGFGDGQWDAFFEFGGGIDWGSKLSFDSYARYTHQLPMTRELRIPESEDFPYSSKNAAFDIKLGDKIKWSFSSTYDVTDWFGITPAYSYEYVYNSDYKSIDPEADRIYELNSNSTSKQVKLALKFSSVNLFQAKKFVAPLDFTISGQRVIGGKNSPEYTRFDLDFRIFF